MGRGSHAAPLLLKTLSETYRHLWVGHVTFQDNQVCTGYNPANPTKTVLVRPI